MHLSKQYAPVPSQPYTVQCIKKKITKSGMPSLRVGWGIDQFVHVVNNGYCDC